MRIFKRTTIKIAVFITTVILAFQYIGNENDNLTAYDSTTTGVSFDSNLSFSVLGDVHENIINFQIAIKELYKINPEMDAMVLNGDTVDQGIDKQYESVKKLLEKNKSILPSTLIRNIGNHEFFDYNKEYNSQEDVKRFINKYLEFSGNKKVYHDTWIKGYHFVSLGSENGNTKDFNSVKAFISDAQLKWFKEKMAEDYKAGRPIFVFLHQHLSSASRSWVGTDQDKDIKEILLKYPEAVIFSSHTHSALQTNNVIADQPFTIAHTGAIHYTLMADGKGGRQRVNGLEGLYVEVHGNKVIIRGRDFETNSWVFEKEILK
jgi:3',5'-cyclic AMP phosphodiesterase CpdA